MGRRYLILSHGHICDSLNDQLENRCNFKEVLVFCTYYFLYGLKAFLYVVQIKGGRIIKGWFSTSTMVEILKLITMQYDPCHKTL